MSPSSYCAVDEIKALMPDAQFGTAYDAVLLDLSLRASRLIDRITKRDPGSYAADSTSVRYFDGSGSDTLLIDELAGAPTLVEVDEAGDGVYVAWAATDYRVWPYNRPPYTRLIIPILTSSKALWYRYPASVKITGPWGFSVTVPEEIKQAVSIQTIRWFKRGQQGFQDVGAVAELGRLQYVKDIDPDIQGILVDGGYMELTI